MITKDLQEFYTKVISEKPLIAVDYGSKKIGIAVSSQNLSMALPLKLLNISSDKEKVELILKITQEQHAWGIVLGLPLCMDGSVGEQAQIVEKFAASLATATQLPIFLQDERLTTKAADNYLKTFGFNRRQRNNKDDLVAASMILESTLNVLAKLKINQGN